MLLDLCLDSLLSLTILQSSFAKVIKETADEIKEKSVVGPCFGHAADGNFHCILPTVEDDSEEYLSMLHEISDNIVERALEAGGTCTGEHGEF